MNDERRNFQKPVTLETVTQDDIDLLNAFRLGVLPDWVLAIRDNGTLENGAQNFNRDILQARQFSWQLAGMLFGDKPLDWSIEELAVLHRTYEKFMEFTTTWKTILNSVRDRVAPNGIIPTERPPKKVGRPRHTDSSEETESKRSEPTISKVGRPRLTPEEKMVEQFRKSKMPNEVIRMTLKASFPNLTEVQVQNLLG